MDQYEKAVRIAIGCLTRSARLANFVLLYSGDEGQRSKSEKTLAEVINSELEREGLPPISVADTVRQLADVNSVDAAITSRIIAPTANR